jgi:4-hydroxybenzoyl-CoA reductase subunit beta
MIRLPSFEFRAPREVEAAAALLAASPDDTMLLAGGTDLLPNMKRRQQTPRVLVSLRQIDALRRLDASADRTIIGAGVTLSTIVTNPRIRERYTGLWQAAAQVATPHLRNMGTIGGNLCLDTRCTYYDQSAEWRKAIGYCMKKDGGTCWVATSSPKCLAVSSTDIAPALIAIGAQVRLVSAAGERSIAVEDLFHNDGMRYLTRRPEEILTEIVVPDQTGWTSRYWKIRRRGSFDFPTAAVAVAIRRDAAGAVTGARVVLGAVASRPLTSDTAAGLLVGDHLTDDRIAAAAEAAYRIAKPMDNTDFTLVWRKRVVRALVGYALRDARGDDMRAMRRATARQLL